MFRLASGGKEGIGKTPRSWPNAINYVMPPWLLSVPTSQWKCLVSNGHYTVRRNRLKHPQPDRRDSFHFFLPLEMTFCLDNYLPYGRSLLACSVSLWRFSFEGSQMALDGLIDDDDRSSPGVLMRTKLRTSWPSPPINEVMNSLIVWCTSLLSLTTGVDRLFWVLLGPGPCFCW